MKKAWARCGAVGAARRAWGHWRHARVACALGEALAAAGTRGVSARQMVHGENGTENLLVHAAAYKPARWELKHYKPPWHRLHHPSC